MDKIRLIALKTRANYFKKGDVIVMSNSSVMNRMYFHFESDLLKNDKSIPGRCITPETMQKLADQNYLKYDGVWVQPHSTN